MLAELGIDGNLLNVATFTVAVFCVFVRPARLRLRGCKKCWRADKVVMDFLNGSAIVPFAAMPLTIFSSAVMTLVKDNLPTLAAAGFVGFVYVVSEVFNAGKDDDSAILVPQAPSHGVVQPVASLHSSERQ